MGLITKPYTFVSGATIIASEHNDNFDTLYNEFNGNIQNGNVASDAAIELSKLALSNDATFTGNILIGTANQGDIWYDNGTKMARLTPGTSGQYLQTQGAAANPQWTTINTSGYVPIGVPLPYLGTTAPTGFLLLDGSTIGNAASGADHAGAAYETLFDVIKSVDPNTGAEVFGDDDTVTLPDMRGRTFFGLDNMGGSSANVITASEADTLGDEYGAQDGVGAHTHAIEWQNGAGGGGTQRYKWNDNEAGATDDSGTVWTEYASNEGRAKTSGTTSGNVPPAIFGAWIVRYQ